MSPGYGLAPRVTQVQQILNVDIMFIKKVIFLLGVFTPLGLGLVYFLRNRAEAHVGTALRLMLAKVASRSFDVIELRCDGEAVIGALTRAVQVSGIVITIAGPGQHVAVVKRMVRTLKGRYRCHELALPFVMAHTLIVWCVMFCMHSVNLQPHASSVDKVSPYDHFSGLKPDATRDLLRVGFGDTAVATNAMTDNSMGPRAGNSLLSAAKKAPRAAYGCPASTSIKWPRAISLSSFPCQILLSKRSRSKRIAEATPPAKATPSSPPTSLKTKLMMSCSPR